ncbi:MAG: triose-phosphate isomerase [Desulfurellaceae bacterium]|nr:triose-phosphate isomerase [Desulfurellaceae bacterium]
MKYIVAGNWKMHFTFEEAVNLACELKQNLNQQSRKVDLFVFPPTIFLKDVQDALFGSVIQAGTQNIYFQDEGAYTGEVSPLMLKSIGCSLTLVGHSERRNYFNEDDAMLRNKLLTCKRWDILPILCIGEKLKDRENGKTEDVLASQITKTLDKTEMERLIIAYEPVWAIGTGKIATPQQAQESHRFIKKLTKRITGKDIPVLYGGSVKAENAKDLAKEKDIDGFLVGGASLHKESFVKIVNEFIRVKDL